jgi:hypothetical protein
MARSLVPKMVKNGFYFPFLLFELFPISILNPSFQK